MVFIDILEMMVDSVINKSNDLDTIRLAYYLSITLKRHSKYQNID